jgi:outer membrane receptor protein involved in Fe transport
MYVFATCGGDYTVVCKNLNYTFLRPCLGPAVYRMTPRENIKEHLGRAYAFWTPHPWFALSAQYLYERVESEGLSDVPQDLKTHRVPLAAEFFHPSGFGAGVTTTYVHQNGALVDGTAVSSSFFVVDAALTYRLPKRYGFIAVGGTNLTDKKFNFFDTDVRNPTLQPTRMVFARFSLALP